MPPGPQAAPKLTMFPFQPQALQTLAATLPPAAFEKLSAASRALANAAAFAAAAERVRALQARPDEAEAEQLRASFRRKDGTFTAYQCPRCRYGPVAHLACDDLESHHGDAVGTTAVNNRCPGCGWFSAQIADWLPWDGRLPAAPDPAS